LETIIVSIVSMALIIISTLTVTTATLSSASKIADAWKTMEQNSTLVRQTEIHIIPPQSYSEGLIELVIENEGNNNLSNFASWDFIVQPQSQSSEYLSYSTSTSLETGQWRVTGIFVNNGLPEVFDPGILNPGESMKVTINPNYQIQPGEMTRVIVSTPNGITSQCYLVRESTP
jgi:hypothetical protein